MAKNILVVEDSLAQRFFIEKALAGDGFKITTAANGKLALEKIHEQKPDLILSDIMMPEMNGMELCKAVKSHPQLQTIPVVLMTTLNEPKEIIKIIESGADYLFLKEFEPGALLSFVNDALQNETVAGQTNPQVILTSIYLGDTHEISTNNRQLLNLLLSAYRSALQAYQRYYQYKFEVNKLQKELQSRSKKNTPTDYALLKSFVNELRTPLNNILHIVDLLKESDDKAERELQSQLAGLNSDHLLSILNDLQKALDYHEKGDDLPIHETDFNIRDCIEDALSPFVVQTGEKQIELLLRIHPEIPLFIHHDPNYLKHLAFVIMDVLFQNLSHCNIIINIEPVEERRIKFLISFPANDKISDYFSRLIHPNGQSAHQSGDTGIDFVNYCIAKLDYKIALKKEQAETQQIEILIPFSTASQKPAAPGPETDVDLSSIRVLVYSDQWMSGLVLEELLRQWKIDVKATGERQKLSKLLTQAARAKNPFNLLLIDARPDNDFHFELAEQVRAASQGAAPQIILLTNFGKPGDARRCLESGIAAFLLKPIRSRELLKTIRTIVSGAKPENTLITRHTLKESEPALKVLVAEDNRVNQKLMISILKRAGFQVELARNGKEAVELFRQKPFDLVLMDMQMPVMDGYTATREIRKLEEESGKHTPIFALTASDDAREIEGALKAGVDMVLRKPLNLNLLKEKLTAFTANGKIEKN
ncbi:response regulator [Caldithrix abyssi]